MVLKLIRHATLLITINGSNILVDPMLSGKGEMDPVKKLNDFRRNPTVKLPFGKDTLNSIVKKLDAVLVTHTHRDHFDNTAVEMLPKDKPIICQPCDKSKLTDFGFKDVISVNDSVLWNGIEIFKTNGHHGKGSIEKQLGVVSGFVLKANSEPSVYIAGDTILCQEVEDAASRFQPDITIVNGGAASMIFGGPITMTEKDIIKLSSKYDKTKVVVVHMEAFNHCQLSRKKLMDSLKINRLETRVMVPRDGEEIHF